MKNNELISHSTTTLLMRTEPVGTLQLPGIPGEFEVLSFKERQKRPRLLVVHESWHQHQPWEYVTPVAVVNVEQNGSTRFNNQIDKTQSAYSKIGEEALAIYRRYKQAHV
ncbi:hypothetical protein [Brenneria tiliae]|uniref:Uncharacterized protein n=1 Tax=Brenneria tiliae TaxID=2914984 RepID=A0ABT0MS00_9GAMM|nr:hypothetical protein [Brenneria tiliae]MCL2892620.1 hypothetical protein [Brenneria tiliae]MCL2899666.1 hypothetical protein [Brenneria tiliae]MCL2904044.1 hypothetical protein [Brenneria tiliae]